MQIFTHGHKWFSSKWHLRGTISFLFPGLSSPADSPTFSWYHQAFTHSSGHAKSFLFHALGGSACDYFNDSASFRELISAAYGRRAFSPMQLTGIILICVVKRPGEGKEGKNAIGQTQEGHARERSEWRRADNNASKTGKFPSERPTAATRSLKYGWLCSDVLFLPFFEAGNTKFQSCRFHYSQCYIRMEQLSSGCINIHRAPAELMRFI